MNIDITIKQDIIASLKKLGHEITLNDVVIEKSKDNSHGDFATNIALRLARIFKKSPLEVAKDIVNNIDQSNYEKIEIAGPGFINFFLKANKFNEIIKKVVELDEDYGKGEKLDTKINLEFVSANPTGILHLGHARCAAYGDSLSRILRAAGYQVTNEYYVNDAGAQVNNLAKSIYARYAGFYGIEVEIPEDGYMGQDVIEVAKKFQEKYGDSLLNKYEENEYLIIREGIMLELDRIKIDLDYFRVKFDTYSFETDIRKDNGVEKVIESLKDYTYVLDGATFLKTTAFLDDKDRAIIKSDGSYTYFTPDIAYHLNKLSRGYDFLIDVLGADHHGYIARMKSALMMKGYSKDTLDVPLIQIVRLMSNGVEFKMSKRAGNAITLRELCDEVGVDAVRYFFVSRAASAHLDFDFDLAKKESSENPVYYAQYAHARLSQVLNIANDIDIDYSGSNLNKPSEIALLKAIIEFPNLILSAAKSKEVQKVTAYIHNFAGLVHSFYTECRVIDRDNLEVTSSRLALVKASRIVLRNALNLIGVSAPEKM